MPESTPRAADVGEHLRQLRPSVGDAPLGETDFGLIREVVEEAKLCRRRHPFDRPRIDLRNGPATGAYPFDAPPIHARTGLGQAKRAPSIGVMKATQVDWVRGR